jgi:hypothetical protein
VPKDKSLFGSFSSEKEQNSSLYEEKDFYSLGSSNAVASATRILGANSIRCTAQ